MNEASFGRILSICLDRMAAGEHVAACLAQYPQHAEELAPQLAAAAEMNTLRSYQISDAGRQQARARILKAELARSEPRAASFWRWPASGLAVPRLAMVSIVALLCVALSTAVVLASQPGDLAYGVRVAVDRVPALLAQGAAARARAELGIADRRLGDLDRTRSSQGEDLDERAVTALLDSAEQAAVLASTLPPGERADIAARLMEQAAHLARLEATAVSAGSRMTLGAAAAQLKRAAVRAQLPPSSSPQPPVVGPTATSTPGPSATSTATSSRPAHSATVRPTRGAMATLTPRPTHTITPLRAGPNASATPKRFGPSATPQGPNASATPKRSGPQATAQGPGSTVKPQGAGPNATAQGPGPNATLQGPNPSATPLGPRQQATPQRPGSSATSQGPGQSATPQGPDPSATPQGPGPTDTPQGPGPGATPQDWVPPTTPQGPGPVSTPQEPGPNATAQGPGPSATPQGPGPGATAQGPDPASTPSGSHAAPPTP